MAEEVTSIKWHPGFCSAMELGVFGIQKFA